MADSVGMQDIRGEAINTVVTGFALREYKFKQLCMINSNSKWKQSYWQETAAELTGGTQEGIEGVPRLAAFPYGEETWSEKSSYHLKHGFEGIVSWEDIIGDDIDVMARTLLRISRGVVKSVDSHIWRIITEADTGGTPRPTNVNSVTISAGSEWNSDNLANQNPIQDILNAKREIALDDYDPDSNGYLLLNPTDYANLLGNASIRNAGQFYTDGVTANGKVGSICGLTIIVSNNVKTDYAAVVVAKEAATWVEAAALTTVKIDEPGVKTTIRSWEVGICQLKNPNAVTIIANTQA